jgi:hypothetical protein
VRLLLAMALIAVALVCGTVAYEALSKLWADYQDSQPSTYLLLGLPPLALGVAAAAGAVMLLRR